MEFCAGVLTVITYRKPPCLSPSVSCGWVLLQKKHQTKNKSVQGTRGGSAAKAGGHVI